MTIKILVLTYNTRKKEHTHELLVLGVAAFAAALAVAVVGEEAAAPWALLSVELSAIVVLLPSLDLCVFSHYRNTSVFLVRLKISDFRIKITPSGFRASL